MRQVKHNKNIFQKFRKKNNQKATQVKIHQIMPD